ncbi:Predicted phosphotransferase related to Ser/Thr protein kinases [Legionella busanensis]|uniref:Predicted phosphotransferase related to Ser/Thr protein kinases n=1 Tax=Legionella busanensis TaxID=190655 RepID=A0A378JVY4_9GAMM|nr:hypothetical protein [Legionella busanensis]STX52372.1 Predicted phosphotransferase related to Ser/Thr protein kinases [Legionella busanensis]
MTNHLAIIQWAEDYLISNGYFLIAKPEIIQETPWSNVICLLTSHGKVYLKQPAPLLANEANIIELLAYECRASVPHIIAKNSNLHCFLMNDTGLTLRNHINKENKTELLCKAIKHFTAFQRSTENKIELLFNLKLPDWRLKQLPNLYEKIINDKEFLKADSMEEKELDKLNYLGPLITEQVHELSQYGIYETLVQPDFNTNNILINPNTQQFTIIDLGELAISHPFFSLHNFLHQATLHHHVKEHDHVWNKMLEACIANWLDLWPKAKLLQGYKLSRILWPIYFACANYHFMHCVDMLALNTWYAKKPNRLACAFREYLAAMHSAKFL